MLICIVPWCCPFWGRECYSIKKYHNAIGPVVFIALEIACCYLYVVHFLNVFFFPLQMFCKVFFPFSVHTIYIKTTHLYKVFKFVYKCYIYFCLLLFVLFTLILYFVFYHAVATKWTFADGSIVCMCVYIKLIYKL